MTKKYSDISKKYLTKYNTYCIIINTICINTEASHAHHKKKALENRMVTHENLLGQGAVNRPRYLRGNA